MLNGKNEETEKKSGKAEGLIKIFVPSIKTTGKR
jgi:hypothetical protein